MDPGAYTTKVTIQKRVKGAKDAGGAPLLGKAGYEDRCQVWCYWKLLQGDQRFAERGEVLTKQVELTMHHRRDLRMSDQVVREIQVEEGGEAKASRFERYDIFSIEPTPDMLELKVMARLVNENDAI